VSSKVRMPGQAAALRHDPGFRGPDSQRQKIGADAAGVAVNERGFIPWTRKCAPTSHTSTRSAISLSRPCWHTGGARRSRRSGSRCGQKSYFDARVIPSVAYTDPEIAWAGLTEEEAREQGVKFGVARFPWAASGRAIANGRDEGFTKLIFSEETHRVIGGAIVEPERAISSARWRSRSKWARTRSISQDHPSASDDE